MKMRFTVSKKGKEEFCETVCGVLERIRVEEGCMECRLHVDAENSCNLTLIQGWRDDAAFAKHLQAKPFRTLLVSMDLLNRPPEIRIVRPAGQQNFDSVQELYHSMAREHGEST
ncbi:putative quinol monooxygenase [Verrucomicrobiota bacterium]